MFEDVRDRNSSNRLIPINGKHQVKWKFISHYMRNLLWSPRRERIKSVNRREMYHFFKIVILLCWLQYACQSNIVWWQCSGSNRSFQNTGVLSLKNPHNHILNMGNLFFQKETKQCKNRSVTDMQYKTKRNQIRGHNCLQGKLISRGRYCHIWTI